ncbi:hypothetical protein HZH66_008655 [Vespula vulgaris]|uniref:Uncharacterized protein n=1 Tax=Vespula vulgaris TaxID=7454 RepID=A0A834N1D4_VESVU|nr:hypothetical protein HZH66_008655 [Vespula vulgaris]
MRQYRKLLSSAFIVEIASFCFDVNTNHEISQDSHDPSRYATIQKVQEGIELAAYESIPGDQRINLFEILGEHVPPEVVNNLQTQIDQIGRN